MDTQKKHRQNLLEFLDAIEYMSGELVGLFLQKEPGWQQKVWLATGYFFHGNGRSADQSFLAEEQWNFLHDLRGCC